MGIPLSWDLSIHGAEDVKARLQDINEQFARGEITTQQYAQGLRGVNRDARVLNNTQTLQKNIFLATHPVINNLTRAMSVFSSVLHTASTALTLINTANIALNTNTGNVAEAQAELNQAYREQAEALAKYGVDSKKYMEATERVNVATARLGEEIERSKSQIANFWSSLVIGAASVVTSIVLTFGKIAPFLSGFGGLFGGFTSFFAALPTGMTNFALFASQFLDLIPGMIEAQAAFGEAMRVFFRQMLPSFTTYGIQVITNFINIAGKTLVEGVNRIVRAVVNAINVLISAYNSAASVLNLPKITPLKFTPVNWSPVGVTQTSTFPGGISSQTNPGEFITPNVGHVGGVSGGTQVYITVEGSILSLRELDAALDKSLKRQLIQRGFQ